MVKRKENIRINEDVLGCKEIHVMIITDDLKLRRQDSDNSQTVSQTDYSTIHFAPTKGRVRTPSGSEVDQHASNSLIRSLPLLVLTRCVEILY